LVVKKTKDTGETPVVQKYPSNARASRGEVAEAISALSATLR
jgi:hypothetical protein